MSRNAGTRAYGLVMGINTWTEKAEFRKCWFVFNSRRLLYQDHGGGKLSRVRQNRESGLP